MIVFKLQLVFCLWFSAVMVANTRKDATWALCWPIALILSVAVICCGGPV